jgi:hypothetical protein
VAVVVDMAGEGDDAVLCRDADMGRVRAGLPAQLAENDSLEFAIFGHDLL